MLLKYLLLNIKILKVVFKITIIRIRNKFNVILITSKKAFNINNIVKNLF